MNVLILEYRLCHAQYLFSQALNFDSETVPQKPSLEELDFYKTKVKLCILLHAFRIRAVTIDRMMSYLSSSQNAEVSPNLKIIFRTIGTKEIVIGHGLRTGEGVAGPVPTEAGTEFSCLFS